MKTMFGVPASAGNRLKAELQTRRRPLWRISITTTREAEDAAAKMLGGILDCAVSSYFNAKNGVCVVSAFCGQRPAEPVRQEISAGLRRIKDCGLKIGSGQTTVTKICPPNWAESWKRHFQPVEIKVNHRKDARGESLSSQKKLETRVTRPFETGKSLLIKPSWSKRKPRKGQAVIVLDPGLGFGTGQHPTTAFCLQALVRCGTFAARRSFLDLGNRFRHPGYRGGET
jgi:ribosomal protein L11 methyltransferase